ncbi:MFS transporter [Inquilinus limosus]|uniref:MFS transporter n=1 Tax=Inquilinus limosus TaxID=171674 RepID=UPI0003F83C1B|nr:MFS transporter [Inquilinus limosus]
MPASLVWLAIGAFAIGTEGLMIAGLLPAIATDFHSSVAAAGQLITIFALAYAVGSPILSALCGGLDRRRLLVFALLAFALANLLAAVSQSLWQLIAARVLLALSAGLFMPTAYAVAASLVPPERRGRAIATVTSGMTIATALGVPLGAWIGGHADWRSTFLIVAGLGLAGVAGLRFGLPAALPLGASTLAERLAVARRPAVLQALLVTFFWIAAAFALYTFIAPYLERTAGLGPDGISLMLFLFGIGSAIGNAVGGQLTDRIGPTRLQLGALAILTVALAGLSAATALPAGQALVAVVPLMLAWAVAGWAFHPAQTTRLIRLAPEVGMIAASLNSSALYAGIAFGSALGTAALAWGGVTILGWVGALSAAIALALLAATARRRAIASQPA